METFTVLRTLKLDGNLRSGNGITLQKSLSLKRYVLLMLAFVMTLCSVGVCADEIANEINENNWE